MNKKLYPHEFVTGFESTAMPTRGTDVLQASNHLERHAHDLDLVKRLGIQRLRYSIPCNYIYARGHEPDWTEIDPPMAVIRELGIHVIADLVHHTAAPVAVLGEDFFANPGLAPWLERLPGRLLHTNIIGCTIFAAVSGSSAATCATIGKMTLPELKKRGYPEDITIGTLAGAGTLGLLIPPSIIMIVYGVTANVSIAQLFIAGVLPGLMLAGLFMAYTIAWALAHPGAIPPPDARLTLAQKLYASRHLIPVVSLIAAVLGSIYAGIATATEAASLGVMMGLALAWWSQALSWAMLREALLGTMKSTGMIMLIVVAAYFLNFVMSSIGLTTKLTDAIQALGLGKWEMLLAVIVFYVVLGCFMETLSMMITTVPVIAPVMQALGFDMVWFGIVVIVLVETALITPPVGLNLFVVQNLRKNGSLNDVIMGTLPFVLALFVLLGLLALWPGLALWLPQVMSS